MSRVLFSQAFSVVVMDIHLPGVSGDALAPMIRDLVSPPPSILLFSALPDTDLRRMTVRAGAFGYVQKEGDTETLGKRIEAAHHDFLRRAGVEDSARLSRPPGRGDAADAAAPTPLPGPPGGRRRGDPRADAISSPLASPAPRDASTTRSPEGDEPPGSLHLDDREGRWDALEWMPRILIVDDSSVRRSYLEDWFLERGFTVRSATDGARALDLLKESREQERPEMVVSDVRMPGLSGIELTRELRADSRFADVPVILYTTTASVAADTRSELEALFAGASEFLRGAVALEHLPRAIRRRIETMISLRKLARARAALHRDPGESKP